MINTRQGSTRKRQAVLTGLACLLVAAGGPVHAASSSKDLFRDGVVCGKVIDAASGKPLAGATVALQDRKGHVIAWTRTGADGSYRLGAPCLQALDLQGHHGGGFLSAIGHGFVDVVQLPVKAVGIAAGAVGDTVTSTVKAVNPVGTVKAAAVSVAEGNPAALAGQALTDMQNLTGSKTQQSARANIAQAVVDGHGKSDKKKAKPAEDTPVPGDAVLLIGAPQYKSFRGIASAYWMQPPSSDPNSPPMGPQAWLDTVALAPTSDAKADCKVEDQSETLTDATLTPAFAAAGAPVKISVKLQGPPEPCGQVCVVAREQKTGQTTELTAQSDGVYAGTLTLDPKTPLGQSTISVAALNTDPLDVKLASGKDAQKSLLDWAGHLQTLDPSKPYCFDPRCMASRNRMDLQLMVLNPNLETPPPPPPAAKPAPTPAANPAPANPAPAKPAPPAPPPTTPVSTPAAH